MMGIKPRSFHSIEAVTLEQLVPADHFYRQLERTLDLRFVRGLVADCYAAGGRPSIDPVVFFKLQLVLFFEGIRSERQLLAVAADRLSIRWYLGYDLSEPLPDHSSLTRIRDRYGIDVFRRFFDHVVEQCQTAGLVWGQELYIDATKVAADAALASLQPRFAVETHLTELFDSTAPSDAAAVAATAREPLIAPETAPPLARQLPKATVTALTELAEQRQDWLAEGGRPDRTVVSGAYQRTADFRVSTTDPDASPLPLADGRTRLGYQDHYVVDGGRARIILTVLAAPAEVQENQPALDLLWHACFRWKLRPQQITGDTKYGTVENLTAIEGQHIHAYIPLSKVGQRAGQFGDADFIYDAANDVYQCLGQAQLTFLSQCARTRRRIYQAPAATCRACALRDQCTTSTRGRRISRSLDETTLDQVRAYPETEPFAKALRKRQVWVEPLFAEAKQWHGLRRFRLRGLTKVNGVALLIATGQNLKRLLSAHGWDRRPWPGGATGLVLPTPEPCSIAPN